jgi:mevalonate pyrophosphate decarboxylase
MSLPNENDISKALLYMAETDEAYAKIQAHVKAMDHQCKTIKGLAFLEATGSVAERNAKADSSVTYRAWINDYENAYADMKIYESKRKRADLTIEVWRSLNANRRQG